MLSINFVDHMGIVTKTYSAIVIKTGLVDSILELAGEAELLKTGTPKLTEYGQLLKDMKAIIVEVFGNQFTFDELQKGASQDEVTNCFYSMVGVIQGTVSKN